MNNNKKNNILVTGGSGFIGSHLVEKLLENDKNFVVNLDRLDYCSCSNSNSTYNTETVEDKYKFIHGSICNRELLLFILKEYSINIVYHLAGQTNIENELYNSTQFTLDNIAGTHNLLECIREVNENSSNKIDKFIFMSSNEVQGSIKDDEYSTNENSLFKPTNPYSATKACAELIVSSYYLSYKLPVIIVRCNNVFGPKQYPNKVIPAFMYNLLHDEMCYVHGDGSAERQFTYIDDVIDALLLINDKGDVNEIYSISSNINYSIIELAKLLINMIKDIDCSMCDCYKGFIKNIDNRKFNEVRYFNKCDKLEKLGWKQKVIFEDGIKRTIEYFKNQ